MNLLYPFLTFIAGIAMATQVAINNQLAVGANNNSLLASCVSFVVGALFLILVVLMTTGPTTAINGLTHQPLWRFSGGVLGAIAVTSMVYFMPRLGLAPVLALLITAQLITATFIDHYGLIGSQIHRVSLVKLAGIIVLLSGAFLVVFGDKLLAYLHK